MVQQQIQTMAWPAYSPDFNPQSLGSDRQSSEATHQSAQYPSGSEALPAGRVECSRSKRDSTAD